jgi:hypothetical protein
MRVSLTHHFVADWRYAHKLYICSVHTLIKDDSELEQEGE